MQEISTQHQNPTFLTQEISVQRQNRTFVCKKVLPEEEDVAGVRRPIRGDFKPARRAPTKTTSVTGRMRGMSINPNMKAKDPKNIKVDEMPRSRDANPKAENLGVLRVATFRGC